MFTRRVFHVSLGVALASAAACDPHYNFRLRSAPMAPEAVETSAAPSAAPAIREGLSCWSPAPPVCACSCASSAGPSAALTRLN